MKNKLKQSVAFRLKPDSVVKLKKLAADLNKASSIKLSQGEVVDLLIHDAVDKEISSFKLFY